MNSDSAFFLGKAHPICQDYALAQCEPRTAAVVIADGCSSSPQTDVGARLLALSAAACLRETGPEEIGFSEAVLKQAAKCVKLLHAEPQCLDATLLTVRATSDDYVAVCYGDGAVAFGRKDGRIELYSIRFRSGYPDYLSYRLDPKRQTRFEQCQNIQGKEITHWVLPEDCKRDGQATEGTPGEQIFRGKRADLDFIAVFSDGVHSFVETVPCDTSKTTRSVPVTEIVTELLAFKNTHGAFVQRRAQAFLKQCPSRQWQHNDDLAVGVIVWED